MPLKRFSQGPVETVVMLNQLVDALNNLLIMEGDSFIRINNTTVGTTFRFNVDEVIRRTMKYGSGGGGGKIDIAYCDENAPNGNIISCFIGSDSGASLSDVTCNISNGDNLDEATPLLGNEDPMIVTKKDGIWYSTTQFNGAIARS